MHVLMISLDSSLATQPNGGALQRHIDYAARAGQLTIVVYTRATAPADVQQPTPHLTIIPTNSRSRLSYMFDALRLAREVFAHHKPDLITTQDPFSTGWVGWRLREAYSVPLLVQNHCYFIDNAAWLAENPLKHGLMNRLGKFISQRADVYRTVNTQERETYLAHGGDPARVFTQPLGTASASFSEPLPAQSLDATRTQLGIPAEAPVLLWVGYPVPFKRVPLLLEVFRRVSAQLPAARLLLVGDMTRSKDDLPALVAKMGLASSVVMYGPVPHGELPAFYALADAFVMTSAYEGVPRVLMEASAAALPLVGFDRVGVSEVIVDGVNGRLLPEGDLDGMAAALVALLQAPQTRATFSAAARERSQQFSVTRNAEGVVAMWAQAIELGLRA